MINYCIFPDSNHPCYWIFCKHVVSEVQILINGFIFLLSNKCFMTVDGQLQKVTEKLNWNMPITMHRVVPWPHLIVIDRSIKTVIGVPWRVSHDFGPRIAYTVSYCQIPVGTRSGKEGEKCRPLDHIRQVPFVHHLSSQHTLSSSICTIFSVISFMWYLHCVLKHWTLVNYACALLEPSSLQGSATLPSELDTCVAIWRWREKCANFTSLGEHS